MAKKKKPEEIIEKPVKKKELTWKDRPIVERNELKEKLDKLNSALAGKKVPADQVEILTRQANAMGAYLSILNERLL